MSTTEDSGTGGQESRLEKVKDAVEETIRDPHESEAEFYQAPPDAGETDYTSSNWAEDTGHDPTDVEVVNKDYP